MQQHTQLDEQGSLPPSLPPINPDDYEEFSKQSNAQVYYTLTNTVEDVLSDLEVMTRSDRIASFYIKRVITMGRILYERAENEDIR